MYDAAGFEAYLIEEELSKNTRDAYMFAVNSFFEKYQEVNKTNLIMWKKILLICSVQKL